MVDCSNMLTRAPKYNDTEELHAGSGASNVSESPTCIFLVCIELENKNGHSPSFEKYNLVNSGKNVNLITHRTRKGQQSPITPR